MINHGSFIISLDFEMMWGMVDCEKKDGYGLTNVKQVPYVVHRMLELFDKYRVHATFATVGMMMYKNPKELLTDIPSIHPSYNDSALSPYENNYINQITKTEERLFFCPELIEEINNHPGMEIGSHTYCHYYCWAEGQTLEQFDADIAKAVEVAERNGIKLNSLIFPRNNVSSEYLKIAAKHRIKCYRGNTLKFFAEPKNKMHEYLIRMCRLIDTYINIAGDNASSFDSIDINEQPLNIRGARMFRPYDARLSFLEGLHINRLKREIVRAAKKKEMYHLWWHPHNIGADIEKNFAMLEELLKCYKMCHDKYGMQAYNMNEMADLILN